MLRGSAKKEKEKHGEDQALRLSMLSPASVGTVLEHVCFFCSR